MYINTSPVNLSLNSYKLSNYNLTVDEYNNIFLCKYYGNYLNLINISYNISANYKLFTQITIFILCSND